MAEVKLINDNEKNINLKKGESFLSRKEFYGKEKIGKNKNNYNLASNISNLDITSMENKENIDNSNIIPNTEVKKNSDKNFKIKTNSVLQEKLKKIFLDRERKLDDNKKEMQEKLKYNNDSSNSENEMKKDINIKGDEQKKISVIKRQNSGLFKKLKDNIKDNINVSDKNKENNPTNIQNKSSKLNGKKTKSFNQKIIDNYLKEINNKKDNKNTSVKDIIEKLKAKKIETEELSKKETKEKIKDVPKINERKNEKEKELKEEIKENDKYNIKNYPSKNLIPNRNKKKNYKKNCHNKNSSKNESLLFPQKTYRDEKDEDEIYSFKFFNKLKRNNSSTKSLKNINKEEVTKNINERIYNRKKKLNSIDTTFLPINENRKKVNIDINNTVYTSNKKPDNLNNANNTINIYKPKKPTLTKVGSRLRIELPKNSFFNKNIIQMRNNFFNNNNSTKNIFEQKMNYEIKENNLYQKKPQLNFTNMNNSFCDMQNESILIGNNNNISCLNINNVNDLNSSFDTLMKCNNDALINLNNNRMNFFPGRITHSSFIQRNTDLNNFNKNNLTQMQLFQSNNSYNNYNMDHHTNNYSSSLNVEDLLILEEKLYEIIKTLNSTKIMYNECFEFWNYYFHCSLYGKLEKLFTNIYESNEIRISINYLLMTIMICYDYSFNFNIINNSYQIFDNVLKINHENLILIFQHVLNKISSDSRDNIWVFRLNDLVNSNINPNEYSKMNIVNKISNNSRIIMQNITFLLKKYKTENHVYIYNFLQNLYTKNYDDIDKIFREKIFRVENLNGSVLASIFLKENHKFKTEPAPYLKTINRKPYSLVLDLDETLVHFKINPDNSNEGVLRVRPGIKEFLDNVDKYYELIIFTAATQEYADLLIDAVEENKIYFEHRLYRQHTIIIGNDFIKDLSRVGRPLDKIAIVDNMPQNFRLQKENGINIKAFWGEEAYDTALIDLGKILVNIAEDGGDIRDGINKYKDEIVKKVTSNISKH